LRQINDKAVAEGSLSQELSTEVHHVGKCRNHRPVCADRGGTAQVAYALQDGLSIQGWHWAGLIGLVLLATAFFRSCPLYTVFGYSSLRARQSPAI
jgi:Inner membrane protein YgaP-like, transmembrane domain